MKLIDHQAHFWELYCENAQYFLSIAVDMSSVVSCWDLILSPEEIRDYQLLGRSQIELIAKQIITAAYRGDFSPMESRLATLEQQQAMLACFKAWQQQSKGCTP